MLREPAGGGGASYIVSQHRLSTHWFLYKTPIIRDSCCADDAYAWRISLGSWNTCGVVDGLDGIAIQAGWLARMVRSCMIIREPI